MELVVIDDGQEDYSPMLDGYRDRLNIHYKRISKQEGVLLGALRNKSLELSTGTYCVQWDDDEWSHPDRIAGQMRHIRRTGAEAVVLRYSLMHLDDPDYFFKPYRIDGLDGVPGTILHKKCNIRYPNKSRSEDLEYMEKFSRNGVLSCVQEGSHWYIRCYHGANTWNHQHFKSKLSRSVMEKSHTFVANDFHKNIFKHPYFRLNQSERETGSVFIKMGYDLKLFNSAPRYAILTD